MLGFEHFGVFLVFFSDHRGTETVRFIAVVPILLILQPVLDVRERCATEDPRGARRLSAMDPVFSSFDFESSQSKVVE